MEELTENSLAHFKEVCAPEEDHLDGTLRWERRWSV